jgi:hypothetical protein
MATGNHRPGGGIASNKNVEVRVRTGAGSREVRPGGTNAPGSSYGSHVTNQSDTGYRGPKFYGDKSFQPVPFGNEVALNVGKGGCGTGRTLYGQSGSQQQYGAGNPGSAPAKNRDILSEFGDDYRKP